jgi:NADH-quinone oxidoreductase subunit H
MLLSLRNIGIVILILGINLYVVSLLNNKITSKIELRRGYHGYKKGSYVFPFSSSLKYIAKDYNFSFWDALIFVLSIIIWAFIPISFNIAVVSSSFNLLIAVVIYIILLISRVFSVSYSNYAFIISDVFKRVNQMLSIILPTLFCILSIIILNNSLDFKIIVNSQYQYWNVVYQPVGFIVFFMSTVLQIKLLNLSEINQLIFTNNSHKEGEGITRFANRFSSYTILFFNVFLFNILYLGGWQKFHLIRGEIMVAIKFYVVLIVVVLFERSISNISDVKKIINLNYKLLLPLSFFNLFLTIIFLILRQVYSVI